MTDEKLPPVTGLGITSLALVVAGGVYIAAHLPHQVPLGLRRFRLCACHASLRRRDLRVGCSHG